MKPQTSGLNDMRRSLADAQDAKLTRVVALVDEMANRGDADRLIEPVRPRLSRLRPHRPLRFARLLFAPMDILIVPPARWRPDDPAIPRSVLMSIANTVRMGLGALAAEIDQSILGRTTQDAAAVEGAGAILWPKAASVLLNPPGPVDWHETGLPAHLFPPLAHAVAAVLLRLPALRRLIDAARDGALAIGTADLVPVVEGLEASPPRVQVMVLMLLIAGAPETGVLLRGNAAKTLSAPSLRWAAQQASDHLLERLSEQGMVETPIIGAAPTAAAEEVRRMAALLHDIQVRCLTDEQRTRARRLQQRLGACCQERFAEAMANDFLAPLRSLETRVGASGQTALETAARQVRRLAVEGRQLGRAETYDRLLTEAMSALEAVGRSAALPLSHWARLIELLSGPEAALAVWEAGQQRPPPGG